MSSELTTPETMGFLERATRDPSIDVAKLEQLIALQERVYAREAARLYAKAMNDLQVEMPQITRDKANPGARSRYASYEGIDAILRPLYTQHGFSVRFTTQAIGGRIRVGCTVSHVSGHSESEHELESGPDTSGARGTANKTEVQGIGSIVSYLKRYTLMAAFAVALQDDETDDDGEGVRRPPDTRRDEINREVPVNKTNGGQDPWTLWLDTLDLEAAKISTQAEWDAFWARPQVVRAGNGLTNGNLERFKTIQLTHARRVFPTEAEKREAPDAD